MAHAITDDELAALAERAEEIAMDIGEASNRIRKTISIAGADDALVRRASAFALLATKAADLAAAILAIRSIEDDRKALEASLKGQLSAK